jgi:hypothetical protein
MYSVVVESENTYRSVTVRRNVFRSKHHTHCAVGMFATMLNRSYRHFPIECFVILHNCLTQLSRALVPKQIIFYIVNKFAIFMEPEVFLPC